MSEGRSSGIERRHLIAATVGGALFGSAWGLALGHTTTDPDTPSVTVVWNHSGFAALVDYRRRRVLVLDSGSAAGQDQLTQLVTGFMRQRIDTLLATDVVLDSLSSGFRARWRITDVLAVEPNTAHPQIGMAGRQLEIDDLAIAVHGTQTGTWRRGVATGGSWYTDIRRRRSRLVIAGSAGAAGSVTPDPDTTTALLVLDDEIDGPPLHLAGTIIAAPDAAPIFDDGEARDGAMVRLYRESPAQFELPGDGVVVPPD